MSATDTDTLDDDVYPAARRKLYALLDELKRGDLALGSADYARVDRVLLLLAARGIQPDDPRALHWLAPVLCGTPAEQARFHSRFQQFTGAPRPDRPLREIAAPKSAEEVAVDRQPERESRLRRSVVAGIAVVVIVVLIVFLGYFAARTPPDPTEPQPRSEPTAVLPPPDLSTEMFDRPLALLPIGLLGAFLLWRRSRRLMLMRAFAPTPDRSEKVAFAAAQPRFYADPGLRRAFAAFRRHWAAPGGALHVRRSINATMRAGGRPELRYGTRPRTPEYVLLVDRETPRDHLSAAAALLVNQLTEERIIVARYDYYGDPRRLVQADRSVNQPGEPLKLLDVAALHAQHTVLIFAEASTFFDTTGRLHRWVATVRDWGRPVLLTPRPPELWDQAEREIEREGIPVIPALSQGLEMLAERLKLGPDLPVTSWKPDDGSASVPLARFDLAMGLESHRGMLTDENAPPKDIIGELLMDLRAALGQEGFLLLQALAVFPRLEPALTVHLGSNLFLNGKPLLNEKRLLAIGRLPWLRIGSMPEWLRGALVHGLDRHRLDEILNLLQSFLQPVENPRTGTLSLEIGRRRGQGYRDLLLQWIKRDQDEDLDDRILVDALSGRDPLQLGVPIPWSLADRLKTLFRGTEWMAAAFALLAAGLVALLHGSIVNVLGRARNWIRTLLEPWSSWQDSILILTGFDSWMGLAWLSLLVAVVFWLIQQRRETPVILRLIPVLFWLQSLFAAGISPYPSQVKAPFFLASFIVVALLTLSRIWRAGEAAPRAQLFLSPGPAIVELPLFAIWIAVPSLAASNFSIHDFFLGNDFVSLEIITISLAAFFIFCKTRMYPASSRCSQADSWRIAIVFGLGQSLLPLLLAGILLSGDDTIRRAAQRSDLPGLAFTLTRILSGMICLQATFGREKQDGSWLWPLGLIAIYAGAVGLLNYAWNITPEISKAFLTPRQALNVAAESFFVLSCVFATAKFLSRQSQIKYLLVVAGPCSAAWIVIVTADLFTETTYTIAKVGVALVAIACWLALRFTLRRRSDFSPSDPQALNPGEVIRETRAFLVASMPWPLVPVLWLAALYVRLPGQSELPLEFLDLLVPAAVWLGYRYPARAIKVLALGGVPLLVGVDFGMVGTQANLGALVAALLVGQLVVDRNLLSRIVDANTITPFQLFFVLVLLGTQVSVQLGSFTVGWGFLAMIPVAFFFIGLSRIPVFRLSIMLLLLAFAMPPLLFPIYRYQHQAVLPFTYEYLSSPAASFTILLVLYLSRSLRPDFLPRPHAIERMKVKVGPIILALSPAGIAVLLVVLGHVEFAAFGVIGHGLVQKAAMSCVLFWAGFRFGRFPALFAWAAAIVAALLFSLVLTEPAVPLQFESLHFFLFRLEFSTMYSQFSCQMLLGTIFYAVLGWRLQEVLFAKAGSVEGLDGSTVRNVA